MLRNVVLRPILNLPKIDGVVKTLHLESHRFACLVRCHSFSIIMAYRMYAEIKEKLHASNMKSFGVEAYLLIHRN